MANLLQLLSEGFTLITTAVADAEVDEAELATGQPVALPIEPQIGTTGGKPIYLVVYLSTSKTLVEAPSPVTPSGGTEVSKAPTA